MLGGALLSARPSELSLRMLAHVGDAVFHLFERERELVRAASASQMHRRARVSAKTQAGILADIEPFLTDYEKDIVRRARNLTAKSYQKADQTNYRRATAFEALLGYLYMCDPERLKHVLQLTVDADKGIPKP